MKPSSITVVGNTAMLHGIKIDGVEERSAELDSKEFISCSTIISAGIQLIRDPKIGEAVRAKHKENTRCYILSMIVAKGTEFIPIEAMVVEMKDGGSLFAQDPRFKSYVEGYSMDYMIPIYTKVINGKGFHAGVVGQPWLV
jgi:hypothetical protein